MSSQMRSAGAALTAGLTVPILGFLGASVKTASDNENALAQLNQVIKSTGDVSGVTAKQAEAYAESLAKTTRFSKDTVLSTEDLLLTFTSISKDIFPDVTKATLDMSQALGQDTKSSAIQLGKALQDPEKGIGALKRVGVDFTESQKEQIKQLVAAGKQMEAQKIILREIQREFGGSAVAAGKTFAGQLDILNHSFTDFQEKVGYIIIPILEDFMKHISDLVSGLNNLNPNILRIGIVAAVALAALGPILGLLGSIGAVIGIILSPIGLLIAAVAGLGLVIGAALTGQLPALIKGVEGFVTGLVGKIGEFITTNAPKVVKAFEDVLGKVGDWLSSGGLGKLVIGLGDLIGKAANWFITDGAPGIIKGIDGLMKAVQDFLSSPGWIKFRDGLLAVIKQAGDWIIGTGWPLLKDSVSKMVDLIIAEFKRITDGLTNSIVTGVTNAVGSVAGIHVGTNASGGLSASGGQAAASLLTGLHNIFPGFASGGFIGGPTTANLGENGSEYVVPSQGALVLRGGGSQTIHIELNGDGFVQHIYAGVAQSMVAGIG